MILVLASLLVVLSLLAAALFLFGFRLGEDHSQSELRQVRLEAAQAERQLHDLTRQAFVAMARRVEQHRQTGQPGSDAPG